MVLSPEARNFLVGKCLARAHDYSFLVDTFLPGCLIFGHYVGGVHLNERLGLMMRPRPLRLACQSIWLATMILYSCVVLSWARLYFERRAIRIATRTPAEARGGVEFFTKCLERNTLLCRILGPESAYYFTEEGEVVANFYELPFHVSWRGFRDYCQARLESLEQEQESA